MTTAAAPLEARLAALTARRWQLGINPDDLDTPVSPELPAS